MIYHETRNGYRLTVEHDDDSSAFSPREWTRGCELVLAHKRYTLPNELGIDFDACESWAEALDAIRELEPDAALILPVYMFDHGGTVLRAGEANPFGDPWDSGQVGFAVVTARNVADTGGEPRQLIDSDLDIYTQWANGEVYRYEIEGPDGEFVDSCGDFYGLDYCEAEALAALTYAIGNPVTS